MVVAHRRSKDSFRSLRSMTVKARESKAAGMLRGLNKERGRLGRAACFYVAVWLYVILHSVVVLGQSTWTPEEERRVLLPAAGVVFAVTFWLVPAVNWTKRCAVKDQSQPEPEPDDEEGSGVWQRGRGDLRQSVGKRRHGGTVSTEVSGELDAELGLGAAGRGTVAQP